MTLRTRLLAGLAAVLLLAPAGPSLARSMPSLDLRLTPSRMDEAGGRGGLGVEMRFSELSVQAGAPLLTLPLVIANTATVAETLTGLKAFDADGEIPLTIKDDPATGMVWSRHWLAGRATRGPVVVRYVAPVDNTPPTRGSGPPYALRTEGGGVSGVGNTFVLLPEDQVVRRIRLSWDLGALPEGSTATSSFGEGDVALPDGPAGQLASTVFMAGPMKREPAVVSETGFSAAWMGAPPFDPAPLMAWTNRLHGWMSGFFQDKAVPPYRVFLRYNPINAGGGTALTRSFLTTYGADTKGDSLKGTLSHEMVHTWTDSDAGQWYGEGIAVHYQGLLPFRAGLLSADEFLEDLNETARRYYANPLNGTPDGEIAPRFWEDSRIRVLPYDRGGLYFAVLDGKIRRASGGKRSVDDLVLEMNRRFAAGQKADDAVWIVLVTGELGEDGRKLHEAMLAGGLMLPQPDDFGPCFTRTTAKVRRFELGFEPKSLVGTTKTIRGLIPGSEAAKAGLRDGDVVTYAVALDGVQGDPAATLTLKVTRDGKTFPLTYLPRGEQAEVYQWARKPGTEGMKCVY
ncbi:peptidase M61 [Caulobacter sp. 602-2]|uniref:Peptidase M61 n=1 Tax=Caulobacter sp. 602-2 TaxID=2710887 RepID=A0A6G4QZL9_9CAUL|nr:peptidase M61 [Caulobacter sp. 602-2]NGM50899.1 peptidase M61 [Caulobacter sp. 602-2]